MSKLNSDGLVAGQPVDFQTIMRVNRERKLKEIAAAAEKKAAAKAKRPVKSTKTEGVEDGENS